MNLIRLTAVTLLLLPLMSISQEISYKVKGKVGSYNSPAVVIMNYARGESRVADTAKMVNGTFQFSGKIDKVTQAKLTLALTGKIPTDRPKDMNDAIGLYLDKGTVTITSKDLLKNATVKGTSNNIAYQQLQKSLAPIDKQTIQLRNAYMSLSFEQRKIDSIAESFDKRKQDIDEKRSQVYLDFINAHPNSLITIDAIRAYAGSKNNLPNTVELFEGLSSKVKQSKSGQEYLADIETAQMTSSSTKIGQQAPDFTQNDPNGKPVKLSDFRGKYVLLDFWASWCGPCRAENPNLISNYNTYKDKGFTILGVSLDAAGAKEKWQDAIKNDGLIWTQVSDLKSWNNAAAKQYGITAIPQNFLIDPNGVIIAKGLRGEQLGEKLAEIFKDK